LDRHEQVILRITTPDGFADMMIPATVRWRREQAPGRWLAGCNTNWQLDLETLGQLGAVTPVTGFWAELTVPGLSEHWSENCYWRKKAVHAKVM
jgi:hypothetical protein